VPTTSRSTVVLLALLLAFASPAWYAPAAGEPTKAPRCTGRHWVGAWAAAPSNAGHGEGIPGTRPLGAQTVRMVVRPTLDGRRVRVRLSHRYGDRPARIEQVTVAVRDDGATAVPGTMRTLTFGGRQDLVIRPGRDVTSDPVRLGVRAGRDLLVSLHVPEVVESPTEHFVTNQTGYLAPSGSGNSAADQGGRAFVQQTRHAFSVGWYFLAGVDVLAPRRTGAVVAFGDSITDGFQVAGSGPLEDPEAIDRNARYPDFLAARLARAGVAQSVLNSGISGNRVLADAETPWPYGDAALIRFRADALRLPGVTDVILMEGLNDLGNDDALPARELIRGLRALVRRAQRAGLTVHLGTLPPTGGARDGEGHGSAATARRRQVVNRWIRTSGIADSVVDFDRALRHPGDPSRLRPAYDSGDHLHPSTAGYRAMARAVPVKKLAGTGCR
jgi:lysophospholipase L1-like esterase